MKTLTVTLTHATRTIVAEGALTITYVEDRDEEFVDALIERLSVEFTVVKDISPARVSGEESAPVERSAILVALSELESTAESFANLSQRRGEDLRAEAVRPLRNAIAKARAIRESAFPAASSVVGDVPKSSK